MKNHNLKVKQADCSFCNKNRTCITSPLTNKNICITCQQAAREILGTINVGSINCLKCMKHDKITVEMENGTVIHYRGDIMDANGFVCYTPTEFTGNYKRPMRRKSAKCGHCGAPVPIYLLDRNDYIL
jgi:hypothetical protein